MSYLFDNMAITYDSTDDAWNSGYRDRTRGYRTPGSANQIVDVPDERFTRAVANDLPSTAEYQALREIPKLTSDLTRAINDGNTPEAQKLGDQIDSIAKEYSPYFNSWAGIDGRDLHPDSAVAKLVSTARILSDGSWKTNAQNLSDLAGSTGPLTMTYNDFVNFDSPAAVNSRKIDFTSNWGFSDELADVLADRTKNVDDDHTVLREITKPYLQSANKITDPVKRLEKTKTMGAKVRLVHEMWNGLRNLRAEGYSRVLREDDKKSQHDAARMIDIFMDGVDGPQASNFDEFLACAKEYYGLEDYKGSAEGFAREWKKTIDRVAKKTETKTARSADGSVLQLPTETLSNADRDKTSALLTKFANKYGYKIVGPGRELTEGLARTILAQQRTLGFDPEDVDVTNDDWVDYAHYVQSGASSTGFTEGAARVKNLIETYQLLQDRFSTDVSTSDAAIPTQPAQDASGQRQPAPWLQPLSPVTDMTRRADQDLAGAVLPKLTAALTRGTGSLTRDQVVDILKKSDSAVMRSIKRNATSDEDRDELVRGIADYYYAKATGDHVDRHGNPINSKQLQSLSDFGRTSIEGTHVVRDGVVVSKLKETPPLPSYTGDTKKDFITAVGASFFKPEGYKGPDTSELLGGEFVETEGFNEFAKTIYKVPTATTGDIAYQYRENTVQPAGTKFLMNLAAKELDIPGEVTGLLKTEGGKDSRLLDTLTKMCRGQVNPVADFSTDSTWFGVGTDNVGLGDDDEARERYREVFDFAMKIYRVGDPESLDNKSLQRRAFAQDLAVQTLYNLLRVDSSTLHRKVFSDRPGTAHYRWSPTIHQGPNYGYLDSLRRNLGEEFASELDKYINHDHTNTRSRGSDDVKDWNDFRARRDEVFSRLNNNYTQSFLKQYQITLGKGQYDPVWALNAAHETQGKRVETRNNEQRQADAARTGGVVGLWNRAVGETLTVDDTINPAAKRLADSMAQKSGVPETVFSRDYFYQETKALLTSAARDFKAAGFGQRLAIARAAEEIGKNVVPVFEQIRNPADPSKPKYHMSFIKSGSLNDFYDELPEASKAVFRGKIVRYNDGEPQYEYDGKREFIKSQSIMRAGFIKQMQEEAIYNRKLLEGQAREASGSE